MSHRAVPARDDAAVEMFDYGHPTVSRLPRLTAGSAGPRAAQLVRLGPARQDLKPPPGQPPAGLPPAPTNCDAAFAEGYAHGERAGIDAAARQLDAQHTRLAQTLEDLVLLREQLTYRTERQLVELALALAHRILHREVATDRELLLAMARLALDRLGDVTAITVRLHPDDEAAVRGLHGEWPTSEVQIVPDAAVKPGGCLVQTDLGHVDVGLDSQLRTLQAGLLGDGTTRTALELP